MIKKSNVKNTHKFKTMTLSIFIAVIIWFMVIYINDPDITTTVSDLNVRFVGEMSLRDNGLAVTGKDEIPELSVVVTGKRSDLMDFMDDIYVQVNLGDITSTGEYELSGVISIPTTRISVEKEKYGDIPIVVETLEKKEIEVKAKQVGTIKDKLVKTEVVNPTVVITGAKSELDEVGGATANVDISAIEKDGTQKVGYLLTNSSGELIEKNETIESARSYVEVTNTIYDAVTLPVVPRLSAELDKNYILNADKSAVMPTTVTVGVNENNKDDKLIALIDKISPGGVGEYKLEESNGLYIPSDLNTVKVKPDVVKKTTLELELPVDVKNIAEGLRADVIGNLTVKVWGEDGKVNDNSVKLYVDASGYSAGVYNMPVKIDGTNVGLAENYTVEVFIE